TVRGARGGIGLARTRPPNAAVVQRLRAGCARTERAGGQPGRAGRRVELVGRAAAGIDLRDSGNRVLLRAGVNTLGAEVGDDLLGKQTHRTTRLGGRYAAEVHPARQLANAGLAELLDLGRDRLGRADQQSVVDQALPGLRTQALDCLLGLLVDGLVETW